MTIETTIHDAFKDIYDLIQRDRREGRAGASADDCAAIIEATLDRAVSSPESERREFATTLSMKSSQALHSFARSMISRSLRKTSEDAIRYGVLALLLENQRDDYRATLSKLCMLTRAAELIGVNVEHVFLEIKRCGEPKTVELFETYFESGERDISQFGYREVRSSEGVTFEQIR